MSCALPTLITDLIQDIEDKGTECGCSVSLPSNQDNMCGDGSGLIKELHDTALELRNGCTVENPDALDPGEPSGCLESSYLSDFSSWVTSMTCCSSAPYICQIEPIHSDPFNSEIEACASSPTASWIVRFHIECLRTDDIKLQVKYFVDTDPSAQWIDVTNPVTERAVPNYSECAVPPQSQLVSLWWRVDAPPRGWNTSCEGSVCAFRTILTNDVCDGTELSYVFPNRITVDVAAAITSDEFSVEVDKTCYMTGETIQINWTASYRYKYIKLTIRCHDDLVGSVIEELLEIRCESGHGTVYWQIPDPFELGGCGNTTEYQNYEIVMDDNFTDGQCPSSSTAPFQAISPPFSIGDTDSGAYCLPVPWCGYQHTGGDGFETYTFPSVNIVASPSSPCEARFSFNAFNICDRLVVEVSIDGGSFVTIWDTTCVGDAYECDLLNPPIKVIDFTVSGEYIMKYSVYGNCASLTGATAWYLHITCAGVCV